MSEGETEAQRSGSDLVKRIEAADVRASLGHGGAGLARGRVPGEEAGAGNGHSGLPRKGGGAALPRRLLPAPLVLAAHRTPAPTSELRPPPWRVPLCQAAYVTDPLTFCDPPPGPSGTAHLPPSPPGWHHYSPKGPGLTKAKALPRPTLGWRICSEQRGSF